MNLKFRMTQIEKKHGVSSPEINRQWEEYEQKQLSAIIEVERKFPTYFLPPRPPLTDEEINLKLPDLKKKAQRYTESLRKQYGIVSRCVADRKEAMVKITAQINERFAQMCEKNKNYNESLQNA